ncbi:hypothetical protein N7471_012654 [Penicillium samsonianum]|uniref:uncharacterized protein n=1 Tax=Penicillium samsonianum TaxID=1882272 RepID=UPI0025484DA7|nr:uncharacterized protein N7471_012654 [Penicillium samsonianum]KAJ6125337.1 hypothetical protein N7471_012654 [Penicillium samsonianum]
MNYDFPDVVMVGGRWRSARAYARDGDTTPIITCSIFDSLLHEYLALNIPTYSSAEKTPMSATPTF